MPTADGVVPPCLLRLARLGLAVLITGSALITGAAGIMLAAGPAGASQAGGVGHILYVGRWTNHSSTFASIQAAVTAAHSGDEILVAPGDYHESPKATAGVLVTTPDITIRGVNRNTVVVDGTKPGAATSCDPAQRYQNFGPGDAGRNGIVVRKASGVRIENLTVCNFIGPTDVNRWGNQVWFDGGTGSDATGMGAYTVMYLTATSTYQPDASEPPYTTVRHFVPSQTPGLSHVVGVSITVARTGVLVSNASGPGVVEHSFGSNMADSGFHIASCQECNASFDHDAAFHNVIGLSATDAGGNLVVSNSTFMRNGAGINLASENNEDAPPPQDGACPPGGQAPVPSEPGLCTVIEHNTVRDNNAVDVSPDASDVLLGAGIDIAGGRHDLVYGNLVEGQGSYGIVATAADIGTGGYPNARCQGGHELKASVCLFDAYGNVVERNTLSHNGTFANPSNGDLADATLMGDPADCFYGNTDLVGTLTTAPNALESFRSSCQGSRSATFFSVLGVEVVCAANAYGACAHGTGDRSLSSLAALASLLKESFDIATLRGTKAAYPTGRNDIAPRPGPQPSLPN
jgi:hypothetical protein